MLGIVVGIFASQSAQLLVFPKTASMGALSHFSHALTMLVELNAEQAWGPVHIVEQAALPGDER